ncbi:RNA/RNP complex-1-interacting phosphatase [Anopheles nili]|uniref:RNA/RNP complex-1-interacting phosphatase n=1 Tax=Anopheles nili TaxID=185578 RepID=UPI00237B236A|nr:RNA/RNP complex-1-interacting phosphatase [Anopheles nili]
MVGRHIIEGTVPAGVDNLRVYLKVCYISHCCDIPFEDFDFLRAQNIKGIPAHQKFSTMHVRTKLNIGLVVDLTNTLRYYDPKDFTRNGVDHVKLKVPGRVVPPWKSVLRFIDVVNGYLKDPNYDGKLVGVHCTHGLNRTGYFICAYLILELGYQPMEAIRLFNTKRGHQMERENYLKSLKEMKRMNHITSVNPAQDDRLVAMRYVGERDPATRRIEHHHERPYRDEYPVNYRNGQHNPIDFRDEYRMEDHRFDHRYRIDQRAEHRTEEHRFDHRYRIDQRAEHRTEEHRFDHHHERNRNDYRVEQREQFRMGHRMEDHRPAHKVNNHHRRKYRTNHDAKSVPSHRRGDQTIQTHVRFP